MRLALALTPDDAVINTEEQRGLSLRRQPLREVAPSIVLVYLWSSWHYGAATLAAEAWRGESTRRGWSSPGALPPRPPLPRELASASLGSTYVLHLGPLLLRSLLLAGEDSPTIPSSRDRPPGSSDSLLDLRTRRMLRLEGGWRRDHLALWTRPPAPPAARSFSLDSRMVRRR